MAESTVSIMKEKSFVWTDSLTKTFLEMLCDYQRQNGQKNGFSWITLTECFELKTSMKCNKDTLKNKHGNVKNQWKLWLKLKNGETCLGWEYEKQCISALPEWWAKKLEVLSTFLYILNDNMFFFNKNSFYICNWLGKHNHCSQFRK